MTWRAVTRALCALLALAVLTSLAGAASDQHAAALARFRAAWGRFQLSVALPRSALVKPSDAITMRQEAIREMIGAVKLAPRDPQFLESLGYFYAEAEQYQDADTWYGRAAKVDPRQPRVRYLMARSYAARAAAKARSRALEAYDRALALDPHNGLPAFEAAQLCRQAGLDAEARKRLDDGLARTRYRLYVLPAPDDLLVEEGNPASAWMELQERFWAAPLSAAHEMARWSVAQGREAEKKGGGDLAAQAYRNAVAIGRNLTLAEPRTVGSVLVGLKCQEEGLEPLVSRDKSSYGEQLERVRAAIEAALAELTVANQTSAPSVEALLRDQARAADRILSVMERKP
jgi:tetratricopeptide (TPR) repeat protein